MENNIVDKYCGRCSHGFFRRGAVSSKQYLNCNLVATKYPIYITAVVRESNFNAPKDCPYVLELTLLGADNEK